MQTTNLNELPPELLTYLLCIVPSKHLLNLTNVSRRFKALLATPDSDIWKQKFSRIFLRTNVGRYIGRPHILKNCMDNPPYDRRLACAHVEQIPNLKKETIEIDSGIMTLTGLSDHSAVFGNRTGCIGLVNLTEKSDSDNIYEIHEQPLVSNWIMSVKALKDGSVSAYSTAGMIHVCKISSSGLRVEAEWNTSSRVMVQLASELIWLGCMNGLMMVIDRRCPNVFTTFTVNHRTAISCINFLPKNSNTLVIGSLNKTLCVYDIRDTSRKLQQETCPWTPIDILSSQLGAILYTNHIQRCHMNTDVIDLTDDIISRSYDNAENARAIIYNGCFNLLSKSGKLSFLNPFTMSPLTNHSLQLNCDVSHTDCYAMNATNNSLWISCMNHEISRVNWPVDTLLS
ncbi:hypothetical protein GJ496_003558 [Pomphorhynchus laevis]|nr:hypothetical protein GJ496_003558 [Pomphorhynchus laevis]